MVEMLQSKSDGNNNSSEDVNSNANVLSSLKNAASSYSLNESAHLGDLERLTEQNYKVLRSLSSQVQELKNVVDVLDEEDVAKHQELLNKFVQQVSTAPPAPVQTPVSDDPITTRLLDEAQRENQLLTQTLKDYDNTLRLTMSKFRAVLQQSDADKVKYRTNFEDMLQRDRDRMESLEMENMRLREQLEAVGRGIRESLQTGVDEDNELIKVLAMVQKENETLRQAVGQI